jgi:hypothetical protein
VLSMHPWSCYARVVRRTKRTANLTSWRATLGLEFRVVTPANVSPGISLRGFLVAFSISPITEKYTFPHSSINRRHSSRRPPRCPHPCRGVSRPAVPFDSADPSMGKLKNYDCHKQKYYVPQDKPKWAILNLKQASKKIEKEKAAAKKQTLGKKAKIALKLANRKGGQGVRNPANPDFKKNLEKVRPGRVPNPEKRTQIKHNAAFCHSPPPPPPRLPNRARLPQVHDTWTPRRPQPFP